MFERFLYRLVYILFGLVLWMSMTSDATADNVLVIHQNYGGAHTNVGSRLTTEGHTVTYSTSTTLPSITGYDQIWDLRYQYGYSSTEVTALNNFVKDGGFLMMNGENSGFATRNNSIASVVSATGGGTLTYGSGSNSYTVINSDFSDDTGTVTGASGSGLTNSQGQYLFKTSSGVIGGMIWQSADLGSGYSGSIMVTADINMWDSTYGSTLLKVNITDDILDMETAGTLYGGGIPAPTYNSDPTAAQLQSRTDSRNITPNGNQIYITQSGDNLDLDITQYDNDQLVAGTGSTSSNLTDATITGDDNTVSITQGNSAGSFSDNNVTLLDINGTNNSITVRQGDNVDDVGGHRSSTNIVGNYNTLGILQENDGGVGSNGHYMEIDVAGNSNVMYMDQKDDGDKMLFLDVNGSSNDVDILQQGTGEHFLDITAGSNQTIDINQDGSGSHSATIDMSGYSSTLDLDQTGSTDQTYSLTQICTNANGCGTTTINQN
jgi:hypothetical protein